MARIRTVKPEFWTDEDLSSISETAQLMAIGLLNLADDEGFFKSNPKLIKAALFPLRETSMTIHGAVSELSNIGYITCYNGVDGKDYAQVTKFTSHQKINRPSPSKIKDLIDFTEGSVSTHGLITGGKERKGKEQGKEQGTGKGIISLDKSNNDVDTVFDYWVFTMNKSASAKLTSKREKNIKARLKDGYTVDQIKSAIHGCSLDAFSMGANNNNTPYNDIELICRTGEKLESFIDKTTQAPAFDKVTQSNINNLQGGFL